MGRRRPPLEVEIQLEGAPGAAAALLALAALVLLALLGRAVTPPEGALLTPAAWRLLKAERAYRAERDRLRREAEELALVLNGPPDPVRAGLAADRIDRLALQGGHPGLALQREALAAAAEAVHLWAMGGGDRDEAAARLERALALLGEGTADGGRRTTDEGRRTTDEGRRTTEDGGRRP